MPIPVLPMRGNDDSWTVAPDGIPAHKSASIYLDSDGATPQKLTAQSGTVSLNGVPIGAGAGSFDNTVAQLPNNPTSLQQAIVEMKALFDSVLS